MQRCPNKLPEHDTPPALDPGKQVKTVDDFISLKMDPEPMVPASRNVMYNLDQMGNRTSVTDSVNGNTSYTPNNLNQYSVVGGSTVGNGSEHQIAQYGSVNYTYRNDEQLIGVLKTQGGLTYAYQLYYDALGRCVKRVIDVTDMPTATKFYLHDGEKPILEYDGAGNLTAKNLHGKGIDEILMRTDYTFNSFTPNPG